MENNMHTAILCLTHNCNLDCIYCFERKDGKHEMTLSVACDCVDRIVKAHCIEKLESVNINFFGGEPLLKFEIIKGVFNYVQEYYSMYKISFFISTNGTVLTEDMKEWFSTRKDRICLGLSLDGDKDSQNYNRSNSFDLIDIDFFVRNWPQQNFKMTLSEYSIRNYAHDVKYIHSLGVGINGGDVCVGNYSWNKEELYSLFAKQLLELIDYYEQNSDKRNSLFELDLAACTVPRVDRKCCGCGTSISYYETDGRKFPCTFIAPMGFSDIELQKMLKIDFSRVKYFTDKECKENCYLYNVCKTCAAEDFMLSGRFDVHNKRNCALKKIIAIAVAELQMRKIIKNPNIYDKTRTYYTIEAIKKIRELYLPEYGKYFQISICQEK